MNAAPLIYPQSTHLIIGDFGNVPSDKDGWRILGECIGSHEHLRVLKFLGIDTTHENLEALLTGVNQNRTVRELEFCRCHGEWPLGILEIFFRDNQNLSSLGVYGCRGGFTSSLSASLRDCTSRSLQHIDCSGSGVGDEEVAEFIEALAGLPQLKKLEFARHIGRRGCGAVAALLQSPACMLQKISLDNRDLFHSNLDNSYSINDQSLAVLEPAVASSSTLTELSLHGIGIGLGTTSLQSFAGVLRSPTCVMKMLDLCGNNFGDDEMISFADALFTNRRLEKLSFYPEHTISNIGFAAMTRALCNTSSIGDVHSSNHTLQDLNCFHQMPNDIRKYLCMNKREDKSQVAREKIFMHFFKGTFSMEPFHENAMAPNILPRLLAWVGRMPDEESFTALFNLLKRMPSLCGNCRPVH